MDVSANVYDLFTETSRFGHNLAVSLKKKGSAHNEKKRFTVDCGAWPVFS